MAKKRKPKYVALIFDAEDFDLDDALQQVQHQVPEPLTTRKPQPPPSRETREGDQPMPELWFGETTTYTDANGTVFRVHPGPNRPRR